MRALFSALNDSKARMKSSKAFATSSPVAPAAEPPVAEPLVAEPLVALVSIASVSCCSLMSFLFWSLIVRT